MDYIDEISFNDIEDDTFGIEIDEDSDEEVEGTPQGKYRLNGRYAYVTWAKSRIDSKDEFHEKLLAAMPAGVKVYGGREKHCNGTLHYHVVFSFLKKVNWANAVDKFSLKGDTKAIRIEKPRPKQLIRDFLENTQKYCEEDGDTFGERLCDKSVAMGVKKRKWQEIIDEEDEEIAWKLVRDLDPRAYMLNYPALERAIGRTKRAKIKTTAVRKQLG